MATLLPGRPARAEAIDAVALGEALGGVPSAKRHALRLALAALRAALGGAITPPA
jgi:hypothetical protein